MHSENCRKNYQNHENGTDFRLPKDPEVRERWMKFLDIEDGERLKTVLICEKHFEDKYPNRNESQNRLNMSMVPVPTLSPKIVKLWISINLH